MADTLEPNTSVPWMGVLGPLIAVLPLLYSLYRYLLPKPIPGIPCNKDATKSLLGDIPQIKKESPGNIFNWISAQSRRHNSPIFQIWLGPFTKPAVVVAISARARIFFCAEKILIALISWEAFLAEHDVFYAALDAVFDFGFGDAAEMRALIPQLEALATTNVEALRNAALDKEILSFPTAPIHPALEATLQGADNIGGVAETGFPRLAWSIIGLMPSVRRTRAVRDNFLVDQVLQASERFKLQVQNAGDEEKHVKSAIDLMVRRLNGVVEKEGHLLPNWIETMRDETSGSIVAGHDTTSTTLCWGLKYMADDQSVQQRLFDSLRSFHSAAATEN
ncbi:Cytochrome P450 monooxygenase TRI13 [Colletotrichum viniferum]|nr:Cytochrome P450 monooxygenase TRI13 [Colletotrichum viniferum]